MSQGLPFVMAGGGTGGHIIPALAVAKELRNRGHKPFFIGTQDGMEARMVPQEGFEIDWIEIGGLNRVDLTRRLTTLAQLPGSVLRTLNIFRKRRPRAVFSMGGYVAGPVMLAAWMRRIPIALMEPNAIPGLTNRRMAKLVTKALVSFPETMEYFPAGRAEITGMPVRDELFHLQTRETFADSPFTVLITGGSRGSRTLNEAARDSWPLFAMASRRIRLIHQTGMDAHAALLPEFEEKGIDGALLPFIDDMPAAFERADLIICRSGASTVAEVAAAGKPALLVPFPYAADDHQFRNAEALAKAGAARLVLDKEMNGRRLFDEVMRLAGELELLRTMGDKDRAFARPGAAERAAAVLEELAVG